VDAWETPGDPAAGQNGGWDICCYFGDCAIEDAFWDPTGGPLEDGQWCDKSVGEYYGSCWDSDKNYWAFWAKGVVYDFCDGGQGCVPGDDGNGPQDWKQIAKDGKIDSGDWLAGQCYKSRPICENGGYINNFNVQQEYNDGNCNPGHIYKDWCWGDYCEGVCWPNGQFCVDSDGNTFDC